MPARGLLLASFLLLANACRDAPDVVLTEAREALQRRDTDAFLALVEPKAANMLKSAPKVIATSGNVYKVLREGKPTPALLPKGDILEVTETGQRAVVRVGKAKASEPVPMRLCDGAWRIDLLEMDRFYRALRPVE